MAGSPPKSPPATFTSHPSAEKLIESYLRARVRSGEKEDEFIHEADLYTKAPGDLTRHFTAATTSDGRKAWYFFTKLRFRGSCTDRVKRAVDTRDGTWCNTKPAQPVHSGDGNGLRIGQSQTFVFVRKEADRQVHLGWVMVELCLGASDPNALCKVYRSKKSKADGGSPVAAMAGAPGSKEADDEASTAAGVEMPGREDEEEEIDAEAAAARPMLKRKAGDKECGAETAAASPGREKAAVGDSAVAATTGEFCVGWWASPGAAEEPNDPSKRKFYIIL
ncbi:hypothetical protein SETIT_5G268700v2 [Setaria italica]|uniref:NAC domain-containing protein n=1 Tax=Setaria italica TaxID=4555 RepID=A0A368R941_SETIT|nr:NAC domain-containing protein 45-like [Setaria italica]RCV26715.1 hypothetical protein SETIT_5G268700v2 [Setaria italica]